MKKSDTGIPLKTVGLRALFFARLAYGRLRNQSAPLLVTFSLTPRCNFDCGYCYGDYKQRSTQVEPIRTADVLAAIRELAAMGMSFLQLSGGEPLMREDIDEIVDAANALGITLGMSTNGSLVQKKIATVKKIKTICVSYDGDEASNDANRGTGTHRAIMRGILAAKEAGVNVHTYTTVNRNNVGAIDHIMEFARRFHIYTEFGFPVVRTLKNDAEYQGLDLSVEEFRAAVEKLLRYKRQGYPILFSSTVMKKILQWPDYARKTFVGPGRPPFPHIQCHGGRRMIFIDCDGKVYPCIQFIGKFAAQDFREVGMRQAVAHSAGHQCRACYLMCVNDFNLIFNFHPAVLANYLRITLDEGFQKRRFDPVEFCRTAAREEKDGDRA